MFDSVEARIDPVDPQRAAGGNQRSLRSPPIYAVYEFQYVNGRCVHIGP